jgi:hypothetical protein
MTRNILNSSFHLEDKAATAYRHRAGDGVFGLSVGLEDADDIIFDLEQALSRVSSSPRLARPLLLRWGREAENGRRRDDA